MEKKVNTFGPLLRSLKRARAGEEEPESRETPIGLLRELEEGPKEVAALMKASEMGFDAFATQLEKLEKWGAVELVRTADASGEELVELTEVGEQLLRAARQEAG